MLGSLILLTVFVYWNSLGNDFVFDDQVLTENPNLLKIHTLSDAAGVGLGWRPLLFFTYGLNYYWFGLNPYSYHAVNLLLHIINVVLVYFIIREVVRVLDETERDSAWAAFAGAAIFSVHPLLSSAVSYIAGRSSVLCAVFYFLAVLFFLKLLDAGMKRRLYLSAVYAALTLASGLLAWQSKQEAMTLPVFLAALLLLKTRKRGLKYVVTLAAVSVIVAAAMWKHFQDLFNSLAGNAVPINTEFESVLAFPVYIRTYLTSIVGYYFPRFLYPWKKETRKVIADNRREISPDVDRERQDGFEFRIDGNSVAGQAIEEILKVFPHRRRNNYRYCRQGYYVLQASLPGL